ncbi:flagellar FliJ protein [Marmoricola sp. OAE513]|uniref:flagellar FliJ family protein n=1 Tax=Marmoricola sp. OAE513 TaxID=2817894 RepID=UPI001AE27BE9
MARIPDAGLMAVARVRGVRESDSRQGLRTAWDEYRAAQTKVDELRAQLARADDFVTGSAPEFQALRQTVAMLGDALIAAEDARDAAQVISQSAYARWQYDRTRLAAVEMLLDRRATERRAEMDRAEARQLDDVAVQRWLRDRDAEGGVAS